MGNPVGLVPLPTLQSLELLLVTCYSLVTRYSLLVTHYL
jgi:hypothetical protein